MLILIPIHDEHHIKEILSRDNLSYSLLGLESMNLYKLDMFLTNWFSIVDNGIEIGLCIVQPFLSNTIVFHVGILKEFRHERMLERFKEGLDCLKKIYINTVILTTVIKTNIPALKLILKADFHYKTTIKNGSKKGDILLFEAQ